MGGTIFCDPMGVGVGCAGVIGADISPAVAAIPGGGGLADFVVPLEAAPDLFSTGGGGYIVDPLAGGFIDPTVASTAPTLGNITQPIDPTVGTAIASGPGTGAILDTSQTVYGIDPATGQPYTTFTVQSLPAGPTLTDLQNLPLINPPTIPSYTPPIDTTGQLASVSQVPTSVFDPSLLPNVGIPTTPYGGILPPVQPAAPPAPSLLSRLGQAVSKALGGSGGGAGGGAGAGTPPKGTGTTQPPKPMQAGVAGGLLGGGSILPLLVVGLVAYLAFKKE